MNSGFNYINLIFNFERMKNIYVLKNSGRLANQLWLAASVYAYCLEKKYVYRNLVFYRYQHLFGLKTNFWFIDNILCKLPRKINAIVYLFIAIIIKFFNKSYIIDTHDLNFCLPPSINSDENQKKLLSQIDHSDHDYYFWGWAFRNPDGLEKYRKEICEYFKPLNKYWDKSKSVLNKFAEQNSVFVGVHVRHGDYKVWNGGEFYYTFEEVGVLLKNFLSNQNTTKKIVFVLCSDDVIELNFFNGLNVVLGPGDMIGDLYTLSECDIIIGSTGTYGKWAAYYGNIPFIAYSRENINWPIIE